jgi:glutathione S-transferase
MARILIREWALDVETVELSFPPGPELFKLNPLGQVPILVRDDETAVYPTLMVLEELHVMHVGPDGTMDRQQRQFLLTILQAGDAFVAARYQEWTGLGPTGPNTIGYDPAERNLTRFASVLDHLEQMGLPEGITLPGVALASILLWSDARGGPDWRSRQQLGQLVDGLSVRPSFQATTPPAF